MNNVFSQSKHIYKVSFSTYYRYLIAFEEMEINCRISTSAYEIKSITVESEPDDIWCIEFYVNTKPNLNKINKYILEFARKNQLEILSNIIREKIEDQDWIKSYQENLKPIEIGRFFISSPLQKELCPKDKIGIFVEAARAFGTGDHYTTAGCIEAIELLSELSFSKILDIGTGTGILSFAAEKIWSKAKILACDIDQTAVNIAKENARLNHSSVVFFQNQPDNILPTKYNKMSFDLIISNILAGPLIQMASDIQKIASNNASIILSGFLEYQLGDILIQYQKHSFKPVQVINKNSWIILILQ